MTSMPSEAPHSAIRLRVPADDPVLAGGPRLVPAAVPVAQRLVRGLVVVDKPAGCTSHDVVDRVRRIIGHGKVGHAGTLDPEVTGVLPLGLGQGTRVLSLLLAAGKTYDTQMRLHGDVEPARVREALAAQVGTIIQRPPVRSRVKRVERERAIYDLRVDEVAGRDVRFTVRCEAGTYIRKLCHDVGQQLGSGAHMAALRRTAAGGFTLADAVTLDALAAAVTAWRAAAAGRDGAGPDAATPAAAAALAGMLRPLETALPAAWPRLWLHEGAVPRVANGVPLFVPGVLAYTANVAAGRPVALQTVAGELVALATAQQAAAELAAMQRGEAARVQRVVWPPAGGE